MTLPFTSAELSETNRKNWYAEEERQARETRGGLGVMEFWLRLTRSQIKKHNNDRDERGCAETYAAFTLVCRLFMAAMDRRAAGDRRLWEDLLKYAQAVVDANSPRNRT